MDPFDTFRPPENASARWYLGRALLIVGVGLFFIAEFADPLSGSTDLIAACAAIIIGSSIIQTGRG